MNYQTVIKNILIASDIFPSNPSIKSSPQLLKNFQNQRSRMCELVAIIVTTRQSKTVNGIDEYHSAQIHSDEIIRMFKDINTFKRWNDLLNAVTVSEHYKVGLSAKIYTLTFAVEYKVKAIVNDMVCGRLPTSMNKFTKAVTYTPSRTPDLVTYAKVDVEGLRKVMLAHNPALLEERLWAWTFINLAEKNNGLVPQYYREVSARRFAFGPTALQQRPSKMRKLICSTYNSYDLSAAAFSILLSVACPDKTKRASCFPMLTQYTSDTKAFRQMILDEVTPESGNSIDSIKTAITAMGFGSQLNEFSSVADKIGRGPLKSLLKNYKIRDMKSELELIKEILFPYLPKRVSKNKPKFLVNIGTGDVPVISRNQAAADLFMSFETSIIEFIRQSTDHPEQCVLVHDEIMTESFINVVAMSVEIEQKFSITIKIK